MAYLCGSSFSVPNRPLHFCFDRFQAPLARHDDCKRVGGFAVAPQPPQIDYFPRKIPHKIFSKIPKHFGPSETWGTMCVMR